MRRATILALGITFAAGCGVIPQSAPIPKTAAEATAISAPCRSALHGVDGGADLLNTADIALGADATGTFGPSQGASDLDAFAYGARQLGVEDCP